MNLNFSFVFYICPFVDLKMFALCFKMTLKWLCHIWTRLGHCMAKLYWCSYLAKFFWLLSVSVFILFFALRRCYMNKKVWASLSLGLFFAFFISFFFFSTLCIFFGPFETSVLLYLRFGYLLGKRHRLLISNSNGNKSCYFTFMFRCLLRDMAWMVVCLYVSALWWATDLSVSRTPCKVLHKKMGL